MTIGLSREELTPIAKARIDEWLAEFTELSEPLDWEYVLSRLMDLQMNQTILAVNLILQNNQKIEDDLRSLGLISD